MSIASPTRDGGIVASPNAFSLQDNTIPDTPVVLELLLNWGRSLAAGDSSDELGYLAASLRAAIACEFVALWIGSPDQESLTCLYPDSLSLAILAPVPRCTLLHSASAIAAELPALIPYLPQQTARLLTVPLLVNGDCFGLLCFADSERLFSASDLRLASGLAGMIASVLQSRHLRQIQQRTHERQQLLDHIRHHLQQTLDLEILISRIFSEINTAINAEAQSIWLVDEHARLIRCRFAAGPGADIVKQVAVPLGEGIVGSTVARQEALLIADAQADTRHSRRADEQTGFTTRTLISVPLVRDGRAIGAIQAVNKRNASRFSSDDLELLQSIADIAALAIENARLYTALENSYDTTLQTLTATLDARDHETEGHSRRVVEYATRLGQQVGITGKDLQTLRRGAMIHDIGKIGIPDAILHKPGPLTWQEREIMQKHPKIGYDMLRGVPHLSQEVMLVLMHQERWDGSGYPFGLKGTEIPLFARLFALVDTLDAILSDRPYRKGRPYGVARNIIASESGRQFDPALVEAFLSVPPEDWEEIRFRCRM